MGAITRNHYYTVDLNKPLTRQSAGILLAEGDNKGDCFTFSLLRNGKAIDGGMSVVAYFVRQDGATVFLTGEADGNKASVTLDDACYASGGGFVLTVKVMQDGVTTTVAMLDGFIRLTATGSVVDPGEVIPNLDSLYAMLAEMDSATNKANEASQMVKAAFEDDELLTLSDGHFWRIVLDVEHEVTTYKVVDDEITASGTVQGSDYILCPKHLGIHFGDASSRCYLYFFDLTDGEYVPRWDIVNTTTSTGIKNYLNPATNVKGRMLDIPDGVYMQISVAAGTVDLYGWDGKPFGMPMSADAGFRTKAGEEGALNADGSSGLTIPGNARFVCCGDAALLAIYGCKDGVFTGLDVDDSRRFVVLPEGYDFFRMRLYFGKATPYEMRTYVGNVSDLVSVAVVSEPETATARARKVLDACRKVCGMTWTATAALAESSKANYTYKPGVEYNGIPYSSQWMQTHFVGWHVSPHTFVNAAADPESVLYKEVADNGEVTAPYYGLVCSSFATLVDGWPYPQTNAGFVYDPLVSLAWTAMPPLGAIYSDAKDHCLIPERIDRMGDEHAVSMFEAVRPVSSRTTRYSNINYADDVSKFNSACLDEYMDAYGYVAHHLQATLMADAPYADFDDVEILTASALPYHGDRCIHTSEDVNVYINIKNTVATALVLTMPDGTTQNISFASGALQVDVKPYLTQDGIYYVCTDADAVQASFEYHAVTPVGYTLTDGKVSFDRNDWWYAFGLLNGSPHFEEAEGCSIPARADGDYSAWNRDGHTISKIYCVFYKGVYGAYAVPCVRKEID